MTVTVPDVLGWLAENPNAATAIATCSVAVIAVVSLVLELRRGFRERDFADQRVGAGAFMIFERVQSWRDQIAYIMGGTLEERLEVINAMWTEMGEANVRLEHLLVESSKASAEVSEAVAAATVNFQQAYSRVRRTMISPRMRKAIDHGQMAGSLTDDGMKAQMDLLRACNKSLLQVIPDNVREARQEAPVP